MSSRRTYLHYLRDILEHAEKAERFTAGVDLDGFFVLRPGGVEQVLCFEATRDHRMMASPQRILAADLDSAFQRWTRQAEIAVFEMGFGLALECFDLIGVDLERDLEEPTTRIAIVQTARGSSTEQRDFELDVGLERIR